MKKALSILIIIIGSALCGYSVLEIMQGTLELASKYSPEGSNSNSIVATLIIGITAIAYGSFNLIIFKETKNEK